jgi:integrase
VLGFQGAQLVGEVSARAISRMIARRSHGTGQLYVKSGSYYGRWRTSDGRRLNRRLGPRRSTWSADGLTRAEAEPVFRKSREREDTEPTPKVASRVTITDAADSLRRKLALEGARKSYERMLANSKSPKTVRNVITFLHSVLEHAIDKEWCTANPVQRTTRPRRRRAGDVEPDLQFLTVTELEALIRAIPDQTVPREPAPHRRGRRGPAPPPPPDVLGPVLRVLILTAAMTGLRQSELIGLRWRDVDWSAQRIRVRNAYTRKEHSARGKSDLSTSRSVPMADRVVAALDGWSERSAYTAQNELVFAHPQTGNPLDRSKVTKRFKQACADAEVKPVRFHHLRHTFATRMAASGVPLRKIQEWLGHADSKTTQIYTHYAPDAHEVQMVNDGFAVLAGNGIAKEPTPVLADESRITEARWPSAS